MFGIKASGIQKIIKSILHKLNKIPAKKMM